MTNRLLSDKELYQKCLELSGLIKKYRNQFIALLPEVESRKLYLKYGMHSVYEFAAKLGCLSNMTVDRVLKISQKLEDKPILKSMFQKGEVGWSKLEIAVNIATPENEIAKILPTISKEALSLIAKDIKNNNFAGDDLREIKEVFSIKISPELLGQMRVLKQSLEKKSKQPLSWEQTLAIMVDKFKEGQGETDELADAEEEVRETDTVGLAYVAPANTAVSSKTVQPIKQKPTSRYIPASKKREISVKFKQLCSKCNRPAVHLHHQIPFTVSKNHESLVPLCRAHHDLVHHLEQTKVNLSYRKHKRLAMRL